MCEIKLTQRGKIILKELNEFFNEYDGYELSNVGEMEIVGLKLSLANNIDNGIIKNFYKFDSNVRSS